MNPEFKQELDTLHRQCEVLNLLRGKLIFCHKVTLILITQEFINIVVALAKKDSIKSPMKFNYRKEGTIHEDYDKKR